MNQNLKVDYSNRVSLPQEVKEPNLNYFFAPGSSNFTAKPSQLTLDRFSEVPLTTDLLETDEAYQNFKEIPSFNASKNFFLSGLNVLTMSPPTHVNVFNNFRGSYLAPS
jgi:hypothetical protein